VSAGIWRARLGGCRASGGVLDEERFCLGNGQHASVVRRTVGLTVHRESTGVSSLEHCGTYMRVKL
jgi:hypothetical protein